MARLGLLAVLEAKPGKEQQVERFLESAVPLVRAETGTVSWYALRLGTRKFGIFDTFKDEASRSAHMSGQVAEKLFEKADELFALPPKIEQVEILAETHS